MGEVYKAFDPTLQRAVAIKTVRPDISAPAFVDRLLREAQACARLKHPNVVTVHEAGEIGGLVYIVMEYLQGEDLGAALRRGGLTFEAKLQILMQVLAALQHSHDEGVIHRDIKPSNVYRQVDGSIKVVDFGLARVAQASPLTQSGGVMCTPDYASPEQLRGEELDRRTDIYSTGALAYEVFTGRRPFQGDSGSVSAVILKVISEPAPPMDISWSRRFPEIERIVARAMSKAPEDRYASADAMRHALAAFLAASHEAIAAAQADLDAQAEQAATEATTRMPGGRAPDHLHPGDTRPASTNTESSAASSASTRTRPRIDLPETTAPTAGAGAPPKVNREPATGYTSEDGRGTRGLPRRWIGGIAAAVALGAIVILTRAPQPATGTDDVPLDPDSSVAVTQAGPPAIDASATSPAPSSNAAGAVNSGAAALLPPTDRDGTVGIVPAPPEARRPSTSAAEPTVVASGAPTARDLSAKALFDGSAATPADRLNAGLRYRLTRRSPGGADADVDPTTTTFRSGDRVRFEFDSNINGYLYVAQQGSSGKWTVLFPGPDINGGRNAVVRGEQYQVPSNDWFLFDANPGTEQLFVFLSRTPLTQLPGFDRPVTTTEVVMASVVEDLQRRIRPRDLVLEKHAGQPTAGGTFLQATYVVNRAELSQAVAANITLVHAP